jgi:hypothetical protein
MSQKVANIGGSNHKKMKTAAEKIRRSTGYGGPSTNPNPFSLSSGGLGSSVVIDDEGKKHDFGFKNADSSVRAVQDLLSYNTDGALLMRDVVKKLKTMSKSDPEFEDLLGNILQLVAHFNPKIPSIQINPQGVANPNDAFRTRRFVPNVFMVPDTGQGEQIRFSWDSESEDHPRQLHFINVLNGFYTPTSVNTDEVSIFMNSIPTIEFSRCVPFLDMIFQTGGPATDKKGKALSLSLYKSLEGESTPSSTANKALASNVPIDAEGEFDNSSGKATFGMEMFTTPQTLIPNTTATGGAKRREDILDPFRGFMSIESFDVNLQPVAGGYYQKATGNLKIKLHDRSRLHEITDLIRPDNFLSNHIQIEYGWSHPDAGLGKNDYADFLNSLRRKSKWKLFNSDLRFTDNGEVDIDLSIIDLGDRNAETEPIDSNKYMQDTAKTILKIESTVIKLANQKGVGKEISADVIDRTALGKALNTFNPKDLQDVIDKMSESGSNNPKKFGENAQALKKALINLQQQRKIQDQTATNTISKIFEDVISDTGGDPFLIGAVQKEADLGLFRMETEVLKGGSTTAVESDGEITGGEIDVSKLNLISLGKLMGIFVGNPLLESGNYAEVQMFFYPFAERTGTKANIMSSLTTAEFVMPINEVADGLFHLMRSNRTGSIPVEAFIKFIITNFVNFIGSPQYGMMKQSDQDYQRLVNGKRQTTTEVVGKGESDFKKLDAEQQKKIKGLDEEISNFMFPKIAVEFEAVPRVAANPGESRKSAEKQTVLRVHVYDTHAGRQEPYENLLNASLEGLETLSAIKNTLSGKNKAETGAKDKNKKGEIRARELKRLIQELSDSKPGGLKTVRGGEDKNIQDFIVDIPYEEIKKKIAAEYPFIEYGTEGSAVLRASVQTNQNKDFVNVMLSKTKTGNPEKSASGMASSGLPTFTKPTSLSLTTMGCPLLRFRTNMFIDFKTGTSVDNLYYANRVTHSIRPGSFTTSLNMSTRLADGKYRSLYKTLSNAIEYIDKQAKADDATPPDTGGLLTIPPL